ncbi:MAG: hypothetical protein HKN60_03100 [Rhizobiales bacterium]|nr:hypothetical protein [Hyphomicrobiales bacterium]
MKLRMHIGRFAAVLMAAAILAGCQGSGSGLPGGSRTVNGLEMAPPPEGATGTGPVSTEGLNSYKVYSTTESLCERACKSEAQCVTHAFSPLSTINGYVAGQCQLYNRS